MGLFFTVVFILSVVGVVLYLANTYIPMHPAIKTILNVVSIFMVVMWVLQVLGLFAYIDFIHNVNKLK